MCFGRGSGSVKEEPQIWRQMTVWALTVKVYVSDCVTLQGSHYSWVSVFCFSHFFFLFIVCKEIIVPTVPANRLTVKIKWVHGYKCFSSIRCCIIVSY